MRYKFGVRVQLPELDRQNTRWGKNKIQNGVGQKTKWGKNKIQNGVGQKTKWGKDITQNGVRTEFKMGTEDEPRQ